MLILDKRRAIERIVALSDARERASALEPAPPKGARPRVAAYQPKPAQVAATVAGTAAGSDIAPRRRRARQGTGAPFPV
jgi:hypothetical protein